MVLQTSNTEYGLIKEWFEGGTGTLAYQEAVPDLIMEKIKNVEWIMKKIPFVRQVGVCNSLTLGLWDEDSDIDLFVITSKDRLYLCRLLMVGVFHLMGVRRYSNKVRGRFCLSFFVDEDHIDVGSLKIENDFYMNLWSQNIWWLFEDSEILNRWRFKNEVRVTQHLFGWKKSIVVGFLEKITPGFVLDWLEFWIGVWQRLIAHKKYVNKNFPKGVVFEEGVVKCHDKDVRWKIRKFVLENF